MAKLRAADHSHNSPGAQLKRQKSDLPARHYASDTSGQDSPAVARLRARMGKVRV